METADLIDVNGLKVKRGAFTLEIPKWRVAPGQVTGLVGPNGAGKTTLLETVAGRRSLLESVLEVVRDPARSVVISSHMLQDVERIADRLLVLNKGRVVREGPTDELVGEARTLEEALLAWGVAG